MAQAPVALEIPTLDDRRATRLAIRFSGSGDLDPMNDDDLELLRASRLGAPVRLIVMGEINAKAFQLRPSDDGLAFGCTVRVLSVEAGEIA